MIALDCQHVRAQRRHPLHHSWLLEGVLSGFNHGGRGLVDWQTQSLNLYKYIATLVLCGVKILRLGQKQPLRVFIVLARMVLVKG
ncbi:hypothetical protein Tco_0319604 [Tanacetum coccineum]